MEQGVVLDSQVPGHQYPLIKAEEDEALKQRLKNRIAELGAVLVAHYYTDGGIQDLAEETGGLVADSLEMARFGQAHEAQTLIVAGVRFMAETAKILNPSKTVLMPDPDALCSLDIGCPEDEFNAFCDSHPDRTVVVYANTSAAVKARSDWVVTSGIAVDVVEYLSAQGKRILWAPDRYLGDHIQTRTAADMVLWNGACIVHEEFKAKGLQDLRAVYPEAAVLVHPESPSAVIELADRVGSTTQILKAALELPNKVFIIATDRGLFHKLRKEAPDKTFIEAPTAGAGATCRSCAHCPWMAMNRLEALAEVLDSDENMASNEIHLDPYIGQQALAPLERMLEFSKKA